MSRPQRGRPRRYSVPHHPNSGQKLEPSGVGICQDGAAVIRKEHFFVDERCFHCGAKEKIVTRDAKEVTQEAYDEAIEDGLSVPEAETRAEEARVDFEASLVDEAMGQLKENPELRARIEAKVEKLDMGGRVYDKAKSPR